MFEAARRIICSIGGWFEAALYIISLNGSIGATASIDGTIGATDLIDGTIGATASIDVSIGSMDGLTRQYL